MSSESAAKSLKHVLNSVILHFAHIRKSSASSVPVSQNRMWSIETRTEIKYHILPDKQCLEFSLKSSLCSHQCVVSLSRRSLLSTHQKTASTQRRSCSSPSTSPGSTSLFRYSAWNQRLCPSTSHKTATLTTETQNTSETCGSDLTVWLRRWCYSEVLWGNVKIHFFFLKFHVCFKISSLTWFLHGVVIRIFKI